VYPARFASQISSFFFHVYVYHEIATDEDMDLMVAGMSGMEGLLRRRDLPGICRRQPDDPIFQLFVVETMTILNLRFSPISPLSFPKFTQLDLSMLLEHSQQLPRPIPYV
jgi:hypothetical protein